MAEIHMIGEIHYFLDNKKRIAGARWSLLYGPKWKTISGQDDCRTQFDEPYFGKQCTWSAPIDLHLLTTSVDGWPQFIFKILRKDFDTGTISLIGYGSCHVPSVPGQHSLKGFIWKPIGIAEESTAQESSESFRKSKVWSSAFRHQLETKPVGSVDITVTLIFKSMNCLGVAYK
ncbi:B9 domain-containing protein 2-like [Artemia franciscana]|uniref:B9 domain-containing protein 2-like n=1 Tax=Artemia franciscana TaxID=6661 RepID=UPI0032DAC0AC